MTLGIIGYGHFGKFFTERLHVLEPDVQVKIFSRERAHDSEQFYSFQEVCDSDVVMLAVPIAAFEEVLTAAEQCMRPDTIVIDVATVKRHTVDTLRRATSRPFIATHPMFGPEGFKKTGSLKGLRIVLSDHTVSEELYARIKAELEGLGLVVIEMDSDTHDRLLADTLFVTHLVGQTMAKAAFMRTNIDTPSFGLLMDAVDSVANDRALFHDVYTYNPYCKDALVRFEKAASEVRASLG